MDARNVDDTLRYWTTKSSFPIDVTLHSKTTTIGKEHQFLSFQRLFFLMRIEHKRIPRRKTTELHSCLSRQFARGKIESTSNPRSLFRCHGNQRPIILNLYRNTFFISTIDGKGGKNVCIRKPISPQKNGMYILFLINLFLLPPIYIKHYFQSRYYIPMHISTYHYSLVSIS